MVGQQYASRSSLVNALFASRIYSAYDITYRSVDAVRGFGPKRTQALVDWRNSLEQQARLGMPKDLSPAMKNAISAKYAAQKKGLELQRASEQIRFNTEEKAIRARHNVTRPALDNEQSATQTQAGQKSQEINKRYAQEYLAPAQSLAQLATESSQKYQAIDEQTKQVRQQMFSVSWQLAQMRREQMAYRNISFKNYLKAVFVGQHAV